MTDAPDNIVPITGASPDDEAPVEMLANGTIVLQLESGRVRLRRPKFGELRELRDRLWELNDRTSKAAAEAQVKATALVDAETAARNELTGDALLAELQRLTAEDRKIMRGLTVLQEDERVRWFAFVVATLSDAEPTIVDDAGDLGADAEAWMASPTLLAQMITHWQTVPTGRGVS